MQILETLRFLSPLWGLEATYTVHLRLIRKPAVDFLFVLIELFSLGVTAQALREYRLEIGVFEGDGSFPAKFLGRRGRPPASVFARIDRPMNTLQVYC